MDTTVRPEATYALFSAAYAGDTEILRRYATAEGNLEAPEIGPHSNGRTILGIAAHEGHTELVQLLLEQGADPNAVGQNGMRPIQEALWSGDSEIVRLLLERGAELTVCGEQGNRSLITLHWLPLTSLQEARGVVGRVCIVAGEDVSDCDFTTAGLPGSECELTPEERGNRAIVRHLLKAGAVLEDEWHRLPLKSAVSAESLDEVRLLLELGVDVNQADKEGDTAWNYARRKGYHEAAACLQSAGAVVPQEARQDLLRAIFWGDTEAVVTLLHQGCDPNTLGVDPEIIGDEQISSLLSAVRLGGDVTMIRALLDFGADIGFTTSYGQTALTAAVVDVYRGLAWRSEVERHALVKLLIGRGADVNAVQLGFGPALLQMRAEETEVARLLLEAGADPNLGDEEQHTLLMRAAEVGNHELIELLLDYGANINARSITLPMNEYLGGATPLCCAAKAGRRETVRLLMDRGADMDVQDDWGESILMWMTRLGSTSDREYSQPMLDILQLLLERGANVNLQDRSDYTALDIAKDCHNEEVVRLLEQAGAVRGDSRGLSFCFYKTPDEVGDLDEEGVPTSDDRQEDEES